MSGLHADLTTRAAVFSHTLEWTESPADGVWRKRLYHDGPAESGRVTSLVRFDPGASFRAHDHPEGEEIFVLSGTFSDDTGDWGAGSYLLNPDGSPHAPYTKDGCELFVHLRQYRGATKRRVDTCSETWHAGRLEGIEAITLLAEDDGPDGPLNIRLVRIAAGCTVPDHAHPLGEEALLIEGDIIDDHGTYGPGCWVRNPVGSHHWARSDGGALLYVREGGVGLALD